MIQKKFANQVVNIFTDDDSIVGIAAGGSWITNQIDEFSDLDLVLVTREPIGGDQKVMVGYAERMGNLLSAFTGEHVGEPRLLICLYDDPLLHVDIKFVTLHEFKSRVETPAILLDKGKQLQQVIDHTVSVYPMPDHQWMEDRFWTWIHYALGKVARGELMEAFDFLGFLRMTVYGPLLHIKNGHLPRGVRKVEKDLAKEDLDALKQTIAAYDKKSLLMSLRASVELYRRLRTQLFPDIIHYHSLTEKRVMQYLEEIDRH